MSKSILNQIQEKAREAWEKEGILDESISITARILSTEEAIGNPEGDDFPLLRGKEKLMEAEFRGSKGQAFTDRFGDFSTSLREVCEMKLENNFRRAIFVSSLNAVQSNLGKADHTIHCRNEGPALCAPKFADHIMEKYGKIRITQIGYQPAMIKAFAPKFDLRVVDLDPDNIGSNKCGVTIEGPDDSTKAIDSADLLVVTGSTIVNETITDFLVENKPTIFFGTTVAAGADLMGWARFCPESS